MTHSFPTRRTSDLLRRARDGDDDGRIDIWNSDADTLASIANYFVNAGWRKGQPWGFAVTTPAGLNRAALVNRTVAPRCPRVFERHSQWRSEEHTSELQSLMSISYAVFCLKKKQQQNTKPSEQP